MTDKNVEIAQRIRAARIQRGLTQQDTANRFSKTAAAISDIKRGKTQITATDLIIFSELLIKPIEYFFGEDFGDPEIEDVIAMMRQMPPELRKQQLPTMTMILRMAEINYQIRNNDNQENQIESLREFYDIFVPYYETMESLIDQLRTAKANLESLLK